MRPRGSGPDVEFINIDEASFFVNLPRLNRMPAAPVTQTAGEERRRTASARFRREPGSRNAVLAVAAMASAGWLFLLVVLLAAPPSPGPRRGGGPGDGTSDGGGARGAAGGRGRPGPGARAVRRLRGRRDRLHVGVQGGGRRRGAPPRADQAAA